MTQVEDAEAERLYFKALEIRDNHELGLWVPIMWHLALRGHTDAMIDLACWFNENGPWPGKRGIPAEAFSSSGLYYRAYRLGNPRAAQHLAMHCFNSKDMRGYRY